MNLIIDHRTGSVNVDKFDGFELVLMYDSFASTFSTNFYFNPDNRDHAELACVTHFHDAIFQDEGEILLTGRILTQTFNKDAKPKLAQLAGYSFPGVFEDCQIPVDLYPLQSDNLTAAQIIRRIANRFKVTVVIDSSVSGLMNQIIEKSTANATQTIKSYFTEICKQLNIIITHNELGHLVFTRVNKNLKPLFHVGDGAGELDTSISLVFNGQGLHSPITVMKQANVDGGNASQFSINNPYVVPSVFRPKTVIQTSGTDNTVQQAAKNVLAAELMNIGINVSLDRWRVNGKIVRPGNFITILSKENFIYKKVEIFIRKVILTGDSKKQIAKLECVPKEAVTGETPVNIFVQPHLNSPI